MVGATTILEQRLAWRLGLAVTQELGQVVFVVRVRVCILPPLLPGLQSGTTGPGLRPGITRRPLEAFRVSEHGTLCVVVALLGGPEEFLHRLGFDVTPRQAQWLTGWPASLLETKGAGAQRARGPTGWIPMMVLGGLLG